MRLDYLFLVLAFAFKINADDTIKLDGYNKPEEKKMKEYCRKPTSGEYTLMSDVSTSSLGFEGTDGGSILYAVFDNNCNLKGFAGRPAGSTPWTIPKEEFGGTNDIVITDVSYGSMRNGRSWLRANYKGKDYEGENCEEHDAGAPNKTAFYCQVDLG
ncbi:DEHA2C05852p [Debaryomyces hansenii CBS767]|uniref:DEHA2C05852p n=1 Tax=Debaryomyces hansenii (strain ATCC 36239 / CBS 767 / BCRC 21394 / JCM 1990 / NBRC 0083 / IGC 2968) TaxID=284592 RepID=Q6BV27_DEBHA|nr:DEHA2C05852p [Debaryomyces hansenii CBS767]CAG85998.2 DEHA2C05852p [Debaryomyces hansenii CBS767]|eukprot:XP_457942.2 DEHA2C05852p [Debaryomyces hansenii CBS767]